jgi:hypothetical protein
MRPPLPEDDEGFVILTDEIDLLTIIGLLPASTIFCPGSSSVPGTHYTGQKSILAASILSSAIEM